MKKTRCPKCHHSNVKVTIQDDMEFIQCPHCSYDETLFDVVPTQRNTQRQKTRNSPYKTGGGKRTHK